MVSVLRRTRSRARVCRSAALVVHASELEQTSLRRVFPVVVSFHQEKSYKPIQTSVIFIPELIDSRGNSFCSNPTKIKIPFSKVAGPSVPSYWELVETLREVDKDSKDLSRRL